ncbi:MAG: NfeD family protein [Verrucomicrobiota bacterium]|nr:NfeD family protein [Verrucomicrobiota bacterium]
MFKSILLTLLSLSAFLLPPTGLYAKAKKDFAPDAPVYVIPIDGEINAPLLYFVRRTMKEAEAKNAQAIILDMNTPGGRLDVCLKIMGIMGDFPGKTLTYIRTDALSAGALIAISTEKIYMSPKAVIGASAPVIAGGEDVPATANDKIISVLKAKARAAARENGYNVQLVEAFIDKDTELIIDGKTINAKGKLLTLTSDEAMDPIGKDKKPLLASGLYDNLDDLIKGLFPNAKVLKMKPTGAEQIAFWINMISPLLLLGGILGIYIEFKTPGFGIFGVVGITCFLIYFIGLFIAGLSGYEPFILFGLGIILISVELFIWPGHIFPGFLGLTLIIIAIIYGGAEKQPQRPDKPVPGIEQVDQADIIDIPTLESIQKPLKDLFLATIGAILGIYLLSRYLPKTNIYHRLVLAAPDSPLPPGITNEEAPSGEIRQTGIAETSLHPTGKARFNGKLLDVMTDGEMIKAGSPVVIIKRSNFKTIVRELS